MGQARNIVGGFVCGFCFCLAWFGQIIDAPFELRAFNAIGAGALLLMMVYGEVCK